jgi:hypothetical protein
MMPILFFVKLILGAYVCTGGEYNKIPGLMGCVGYRGV